MKRKIYNVLPNMILSGDNVSRVKAKGGISRELPYEVEVIAENLYVPWAIDISNEGKLYITTGDAGNSALAQNITSTAGKILRIELDGSIPEDNPNVNSPVYSLGHRNPQGLAWSLRNILYASEHRQTAHDEINIIQREANYGWPLVQGNEDSKEIIVQKPLIHSGEETWAPSGIAFVDQEPWQGKLLVATLRGEQLLTISLNRKGTKVNSLDLWLKNRYGRLREIIQGKDGGIYLTTINRDGRGNSNIGDDRIIRIIPSKSNI
ncbi:PQQ-dependent sugar dehydrogenase [Clostridium sp. UBA7503]|uniref:PQQ-dependent sugar dehydrogenase n=1 Tax=Clostridium sp. UBA7503 TaxID=1946377 RepID=UPI003217E899